MRSHGPFLAYSGLTPITQDLADPATFISIEVYQDQDAVDRQGLLPN